LPPARLISSQLEVSELYIPRSHHLCEIAWFAVLMLSYRDKTGTGFKKSPLLLQEFGLRQVTTKSIFRNLPETLEPN